MDNPLLFTGYEIPFERIEPEHVVPGVRAVLAEAGAALSSVAGGATAGRTWANTIERYDDALERVERVVGTVQHLLGVKDSAALRAAFECPPICSTCGPCRLGTATRRWPRYARRAVA